MKFTIFKVIFILIVTVHVQNYQASNFIDILTTYNLAHILGGSAH